MDAPSGYRQPGGAPGGGGRKKLGRKATPNPQLFDDTSTAPPPQHTPYGPPPGAYGQPYAPGPPQYAPGPPGPQPPQQQFLGQQFLADPMANMAMQYGSSLADQGKDMVHKNLEKYVSTSNIKYYFAVDTTYVVKKLGLILFPFTQSDWSVQFSQDGGEPVQPRFDVNAPDLYIPVMAYVTYILAAGFLLGTQDRFSPEQLGIQASSALVWFIIENLAILLTLYIMNVQSGLKYLDIMAYCGYKYVGMILSLLAGLFFMSMGYYIALLWTSGTTAFFLIRLLKVQILPQSDEYHHSGSKRRLYLLLFIAALQPLFMWWLTSHIVNYVPVATPYMYQHRA